LFWFFSGKLFAHLAKGPGFRMFISGSMLLDQKPTQSEFFKENSSHLSYFSVWQMRGSSHLAQKHEA